MPYKYSADGMHLSCFRKVKYRSYDKAKANADKYGQRVYFCPICGGYHCTKREAKEGEDLL